MAFAAFETLLSYQPEARAAAGEPPPQIDRVFAFSVANLLIALILGIALLNMKRWSRWAAIATCVASLALIPRVVIAGHHMADIMILTALKTLFYVWVIWYLTRPHIKAAFRGRPGHQLA